MFALKQNLAIIIPAYKPYFLEKTLASIANQTDKNFKLYIGDDASPFDIKSIVSKFENKLDLQYIRFEKNLGSKDLAGHWNRCIELVEEEWIWLFADDDLMDINCVEHLLTMIESNKNYEIVYKFQTKIINDKGEVKSVNKKTPTTFTLNDFITWRFLGKFNSYAVEYVFSKQTFNHYRGFVSLPLAWGSDIATFMLYGRNAGYVTVPESFVYWRLSDKNISSMNESSIVIKKKLLARLYFLEFFKNNLSVEFNSLRKPLLNLHINYPLRFSNSISSSVQYSFILKLLKIFDRDSVFNKVRFFCLFFYERTTQWAVKLSKNVLNKKH